MPGEVLRATLVRGDDERAVLDPLSAIVLREVLSRAPIGVGVFPLLAAVSATPDLPPLFLRRGRRPTS